MVQINSTTLKYLSRKNLSRWLADSVIDWLIIFCAMCLVIAYEHPLAYIAASLIIGNRQHALAVLGHDGTHYTLSENRLLNDLLTNFVALWPIGLTVSGYRKLHFQHHREVGTCNDPELHHKSSRAPQWDLPIKWSKIVRYACLDLVGYSIRDYILIVRFSKPDKTKELAFLMLFHLVLITVLAVSGLWIAIAVWYFSLLTTFMMFFRLRLWLEHQGTSETNRVSLNFWQSGLLAPHNSSYHWEHHKWANIPYSRLPDARKIYGEESIVNLWQLLKKFEASRPIGSGKSLKETQL